MDAIAGIIMDQEGADIALAPILQLNSIGFILLGLVAST